MSKARAGGVAESDDEYAPPSQGAARGAKKHPVTEAVLRFATEKKGPKAGPYVNKIFEQAIEGAEQEATQIEGDDDDARAVPIANMLMMIVAWLYYYIKIEWLDEIVESSDHLAKKARASAGSAMSAVKRTATSAVPAKASQALYETLTVISTKLFGVILILACSTVQPTLPPKPLSPKKPSSKRNGFAMPLLTLATTANTVRPVPVA